MGEGQDHRKLATNRKDFRIVKVESLVTFKICFLFSVGENGTEVFGKVFLAILTLSSALNVPYTAPRMQLLVPNCCCDVLCRECGLDVEADEADRGLNLIWR